MSRHPDPPPADHLSGKRRWMRQRREVDVVCVGAGTTVRARTIDVSRGGMLVEARDDEVPPVGLGDLVPLAFLVAVAFKDGMKAILGPGMSVRAEVVRVTTSPVDRGFLRLGCRFERALTPRQCAALGIDETDVRDPALDLGSPEDDDAAQLVAPLERTEVTARPGKRRPVLRLAPKRERRRPDV